MFTVYKLDYSVQGKPLFKDLSFGLGQACFLAIVGPSGVGKTVLGKLLAGDIPLRDGHLSYQPPLQKKVFVSQQQDFRSHFHTRSYYQQRFDNNYHETSPTVEALLGQDPASSPDFYEALKITELLHKHVISLSNGEAKRLQLYMALQQKPDLIVFDNPFVGLDVAMRAVFTTILASLKDARKAVVLLSSPWELPSFVDTVLVLMEGLRYELLEVAEVAISSPAQRLVPMSVDPALISEIAMLCPEHTDYDWALQFKHVDVKIGAKVLLKDLSWQIRRGGRWALIGPNGVGKSTLLSYISADNPQVYVQDVHVFDKPRGGGESIWDIKAKIGVVSPELHIYFMKEEKHAYNKGTVALDTSSLALCVWQVVASGFEDSQGMLKSSTYAQRRTVTHWLELLGIADIKEEKFHVLPLGKQRVVLLARAMVKNPPLLLLDEPCQGLDRAQIETFNELVDYVCATFNKTLIYVSHYKEQLPRSIQHTLELRQGGSWQIV